MSFKKIVIAFLGIIILGLLLTYWLFPGIQIRKEMQGSNLVITSYEFGSEQMQFYKNMRFLDKNISYKIFGCPPSKISNFKRAIEILEDTTILEFTSVDVDEKISVFCQERNKVVDENFFVAGEGGPTKIIVSGDFNVIERGEIMLIRDSDCSLPIVPLHELLHVLGFNHSNNTGNIMYNVSDCRQELGQEIPNLINNLYSISTLPDLFLKNASVKIHSGYLDFNATIFNIGLLDSKPSVLNVYLNEDKIYDSEIKEISYGAGSNILVENIKLKTRDEVFEIKFEVLSSEKEIEKKNNLLVFFID